MFSLFKWNTAKRTYVMKYIAILLYTFRNCQSLWYELVCLKNNVLRRVMNGHSTLPQPVYVAVLHQQLEAFYMCHTCRRFPKKNPNNCSEQLHKFLAHTRRTKRMFVKNRYGRELHLMAQYPVKQNQLVITIITEFQMQINRQSSDLSQHFLRKEALSRVFICIYTFSLQD